MKNKFISINLFLIVFIMFILNGKISYNEELFLSMVYICLFWLFFIKSNIVIKNFLIKQTIDLMFFYEKLYYLKLKLLIKQKKFLKIIKNKEFIKNIINIKNFQIKKKNIYIKKEKHKKILLLCFLINLVQRC